ncbi:EAL and HDOD domain-containing protein [Cellulomonas sp. URHD0024]|uniref:EAL and HDOD domain-containing protein n=1 Tax=Cellulomonas sp. URHD0024 TaxID=1302620 RepID=UPI0003F5EB0A|nr:HDOD domain-containing protein [Cellulomonas sp. URHD0024]
MLGNEIRTHHILKRATVHRQPIVRHDRSVYGYAVRGEVPGSEGAPDADTLVEGALDAVYATLDPQTIVGTFPLMIRATSGLLVGATPMPQAVGGVALELPLWLASYPDVASRLVALRQQHVGLAIGDYTGDPAQDGILPLVDFVKIDLARSADVAELVRRAHEAGARVIGERADTTETIARAIELEIDLLQGPMFERRQGTSGREFTAGEAQCLNLVRALSTDRPDPELVLQIIGSDPELAMRVLHLVNSSASGLRHPIDSVRQAVVLLGPRQLTTLAMASLINAQPATVGALWSVLARALACFALSGEGAGYTVGLLSAVASQQHVSVDSLVERSGVSDDIAKALRDQTGPYGAVLAAVIAHEENDIPGVAATGLEPWDVAHAYLSAVPEALATATSMTVATH